MSDMLSFRDALQVIVDYWNLPLAEFKAKWRHQIPAPTLDKPMFSDKWRAFLGTAVTAPTGKSYDVEVILKKKEAV